MSLLLILLNAYFVTFTDKVGSTTPALSPTAIEMRQARDIEIDALDYPVSAEYVAQLRTLGAKIHHTSRWFNGATIETDDSTVIQAIRALPYVVSATMTRDKTKSSGISPRKNAVPHAQTANGTYYEQQKIYNLHPLHQLGYEGQGIRIVVCDNGFTNANHIDWVDSEHFLGHYDLTDDSYDFFGSTGKHGEHVLSFIAGNTETYRGAAVNAHYYLMKSEEVDTESPKELDNLVAALEKADSLGAHIFTASLGYHTFNNASWNLTYAQLNGKSNRASLAATMAARKGLLVCIAMGNDGNKDWRYLNAPADADSILAVGAVTYNRVVADFSSLGPSADKRIKPDICALGESAWYIAEDGVTEGYGSGTSYATPLLAGLAACLWSALPNLTNMELRDLIIRSADHYTTPDATFGYGIPDALKAYQTITNLMQPNTPDSPAQKVLRDGTIWIIANGKEYNLLGIRH